MTAGIAQTGKRSGVTQIPLDLIDDSPRAVRPSYDPARIEALAKSIRQIGLLEPVMVRAHPKIPGRYEIIHGHWRCRAVRVLEQPTIAARVVMRDAWEAAQAILREAHRSAPADWTSCKLYAKALYQEPCIAETSAQLAGLIAKPREHIERCLAMRRLPKAIQRLLDANPYFLTADMAAEALYLLDEHPTHDRAAVAEARALYARYGSLGYSDDPQRFRQAIWQRVLHTLRNPDREDELVWLVDSMGEPAVMLQASAEGIILTAQGSMNGFELLEQLVAPLERIVRRKKASAADRPGHPRRSGARRTKA